MFKPRTSIATNGVGCYLPEFPLPNQKSIYFKKVLILQIVNKIISIRLTPKLFMNISKVYVNQGGAA